VVFNKQYYNGGRWQFFVYETDDSAGWLGSKETAPETDRFRQAIKNFPVFGAALKNKVLNKLFLAAIKEIGSGNYDFIITIVEK
jgi:hypothetical protein